jgi:FkbM family methyltransferase
MQPRGSPYGALGPGYRMREATIRTLIKHVYAHLPFRRPVLEVLRRTVRLPRNLTGHLHFRGPFTVEIDEFHRFRLQHWGYMLENDLFWNGFGNGYEGTSLQIWRRLAPHAHVILDVGANTGIYALAARCLNPTATVVALEPVERVFRRLQRNVELNGGNVTVEKLAASDITGEAPIYDFSSDHELTASLHPSMSEGCGGVVEYAVATKRLDDVLSGAGLGSVDLVKIDVELSEPQVLLGMGAFLSNCKPTLLIEILNERVAREVSDITRDLGYNIFQIVEQLGLVRTGYIRATGFKERNYLLAQDGIVELANIRDFVVQ